MSEHRDLVEVRKKLRNRSSLEEEYEGLPFDALTVGTEATVGTGADLTLLTITGVADYHIVILQITLCATGAAWFWNQDDGTTEIPARLPSDGMWQTENRGEKNPVMVVSSGSDFTLVVDTSNAGINYACGVTYVLRRAPR